MHALGAGLAIKGFKVLFVDLDAQCNLTDITKADDSNLTVMDLLTKGVDVQEVIQHMEQWDIIPASNLLAGADILISGKGREYRLKNVLESVKELYDFTLLDTPPSLGVLITNALTASTEIIIPAQADRFSLKSIAQLYTTIGTIKKYSNASLDVKGILLTRYNGRSILSRDFAETLEKAAHEMGTIIFKTKIRENIAIREAQARREDIFGYAPKSNAARDYDAFIDELLKELKKHG